MAIWNILWHLVADWYISPRFGILNKEKSGNPAADRPADNYIERLKLFRNTCGLYICSFYQRLMVTLNNFANA
jgi:hypothetical protein